MTPGDERIDFNNNEGDYWNWPTYLPTYGITYFTGPLYSDDNDDMPLDLNS